MSQDRGPETEGPEIPEIDPGPPTPRSPGPWNSIRRVVIGKPRDLTDPHVFHKLALVAFLAWVGLGADGLSSSCYGPEEAFKTLGQRQYLALFLALMTGVTVLVISFCYSRVVEHFPAGGGGFLVATTLLGPIPGVVSGSALVVDYVLTITVSVCSGVEAILSFLPMWVHQYRVPIDLAVLGLLFVLNLRGIKESVKILLPIFLLFMVTHVLFIVYGILAHFGQLPAVVSGANAAFHSDVRGIGLGAVLLVMLRAYSMGGGTYTGIEAVSNGVQILKEPRVATAKRTMIYMASSLIFTAAGIILCYLLWNAAPVPGKTMNAAVLEKIFASWTIGNWHVGAWLVIVTLISEGALLLIAAQAGFIDGPRVLANMAKDSWMPHGFANLSERLVTQNGVLLMGVAAGALALYTRGNVSFLIVLYSINVFLTFSLTTLGMTRFWWRERHTNPAWRNNLLIQGAGFVMCVSILLVITFEKFLEGGWLTYLITASLITGCLMIQKHYRKIREQIANLDQVLSRIPPGKKYNDQPLAPDQPVAAMLVSGYGGLGLHTLLNVHRLFPGTFKNMLFLSVVAVDSGAFKGASELESLSAATEANLQRYVEMARSLGFSADYRYSMGTDVVNEAEALCATVSAEFPRSVFFLGKLVFRRETIWNRLLHNDTAHSIQRRLQFSGVQTVVLPIRMQI